MERIEWFNNAKAINPTTKDEEKSKIFAASIFDKQMKPV